MRNVLILDDDPADAIILREALLEVDPALGIDCVDHADAALWRIMPDNMPPPGGELPEAGRGHRRGRADRLRRLQVVRHVLGQPGLGAPPLVVLAGSPCEEEVRSKCVAGAHCCVAKPKQYGQYKAMLRKALGSLRKPPNPGKEPRREETLCS